MSETVSVTYFHQSSFAVAAGKTLLIFSYRQFDEATMPLNCRIENQDLHGFNHILVFVPRLSVEHFDPVIFDWKPSYPINYIISSDVRDKVPDRANVQLVSEGDSFSVAGIRVDVCGSTDDGVSFLVTVDDVRVFHAGDLNLWHWREESTPQAIAKAEEAFYTAVDRIPKEKPIDVCMFPLDPNQGGLYEAGANHMIMTIKPRVFIPMHWGNRAEIAVDYARRMHTRHTLVYALTAMRETVQFRLSTETPDFINPTRDRITGTPIRTERIIALNTYLEENPFAETDLPVNLSEHHPI